MAHTILLLSLRLPRKVQERIVSQSRLGLQKLRIVGAQAIRLPKGALVIGGCRLTATLLAAKVRDIVSRVSVMEHAVLVGLAGFLGLVTERPEVPAATTLSTLALSLPVGATLILALVTVCLSLVFSLQNPTVIENFVVISCSVNFPLFPIFFLHQLSIILPSRTSGVLLIRAPEHPAPLALRAEDLLGLDHLPVDVGGALALFERSPPMLIPRGLRLLLPSAQRHSRTVDEL